MLIDTAIPCGLILNELISNALKHAFPGDQGGEIKVQLHKTGIGDVQLTISDNGVGVPQGFDFRKESGLGLQNVFVITENQLQGSVTFKADQGVSCQIRFADNLYQPRV